MQTSRELKNRLPKYSEEQVEFALRRLKDMNKITTIKRAGDFLKYATLAILFFVSACQPEQQKQVSPVVLTPGPAPIVGVLPVEALPPELPGMAKNTKRAVNAAVVAPPARRLGNLIVRWDLPASLPLDGYKIFANGIQVATVDAIYDNCTIGGLNEGQPVTVYAEGNGDRSNQAVGYPFRTPWTKVATEPYAFTFAWSTQIGTTNVLQSSSNLTRWNDVQTFRATKSEASVVVTNPGPFHRALIRSATNFSQPTITQTLAFVKLTWTGDGTAKTLERLADAKSRSYVDVLTNSQSGIVSAIMKPDEYRVTP